MFRAAWFTIVREKKEKNRTQHSSTRKQILNSGIFMLSITAVKTTSTHTARINRSNISKKKKNQVTKAYQQNSLFITPHPQIEIYCLGIHIYVINSNSRQEVCFL